MRIDIQHRGVKVSEELLDHFRRRLRRVLTRFGRDVKLIRVYLRDVNGPRGGRDHRCRIVVELPRRGRVVVTGTDADIGAALNVTAGRAELAVKRHLKRRLTRRRPTRRPVSAAPLVAA